MHAEFVLGLGLDFGIESFKSSSSVSAISLSKCGRQGLVMCWYRLFLCLSWICRVRCRETELRHRYPGAVLRVCEWARWLEKTLVS